VLVENNDGEAVGFVEGAFVGVELAVGLGLIDGIFVRLVGLIDGTRLVVGLIDGIVVGLIVGLID